MQSLVGTFFIIKQELICFTLMAYISFLWYFSIITDRFVSFPRYYFIYAYFSLLQDREKGWKNFFLVTAI